MQAKGFEAARRSGRLGVGTGQPVSVTTRIPLRRAQKRTREEQYRLSRVRTNARDITPRAEADARSPEPGLLAPDADGALPHESDE